MRKYTYEKIFQRNIAYFSKQEVAKIRKLSVAVAGAGGLGGLVVDSLARLGIKKIRIADPENFESNNINRQQGANIFSVGKKKSLIVRDSIIRINPFMVVDAWTQEVKAENAMDFLDGMDFVVDGIEFFNPEAEAALHRASRKKKIWCFTGQVAGSVVSMMFFSPRGKSFDSIFSSSGRYDLYKIATKMFPILPRGVNATVVKHYIDGKKYIPSYPFPGPILANLLLQQAVEVIVRRKNPVCVAPKVFALDLRDFRTIIQ